MYLNVGSDIRKDDPAGKFYLTSRFMKLSYFFAIISVCQPSLVAMKPLFHSSSAAIPIAFAEGGSTAVSMGALMLMERKPSLIAPMRDWLARRVIYPSLQTKDPLTNHTALMQQATDRASLLVKGTGMIGAGFVSHLPIQLALEGEFHLSGLKSAAFGKTLGVAGSLGSIMVIDHLAPSALPALQNAIYPLVKPLLPKDARGKETRGAEEIAKLLILDVPSSIATGLINYSMTRKVR